MMEKPRGLACLTALLGGHLFLSQVDDECLSFELLQPYLRLP